MVQSKIISNFGQTTPTLENKIFCSFTKNAYKKYFLLQFKIKKQKIKKNENGRIEP